jgi:hypothetical protein
MRTLKRRARRSETSRRERCFDIGNFGNETSLIKEMPLLSVADFSLPLRIMCCRPSDRASPRPILSGSTVPKPQKSSGTRKQGEVEITNSLLHMIASGDKLPYSKHR